MSRLVFLLLRAVVRRTWVLASITVVCCAVFAARAAAALVDASYLLPLPATAPQRPAPPPPPPPRPKDGPIVERNMFCSSCAPATAIPETFVLSAQLIAIDINHEPRATLRVAATEVQGSWGTGDAIPGLGRIDRVGLTWVEIVDDIGRRGRLTLREGATVPAGPIGPAPDRPGSECGAVADAWIDRIRRFDDQNYEVDRALVRDLVTGVSKGGSVRPTPIFERGEIKGIRLLGVRPCTIATAVGLANGDMLIAIDGAPIKNLQQLFDLYARLDELSVVELSGTRAGKPLVRTLRLR